MSTDDVGELLRAAYEDAPNPPPYWEELCDDLGRGADDAGDVPGGRAGAGGGADD